MGLTLLSCEINAMAAFSFLLFPPLRFFALLSPCVAKSIASIIAPTCASIASADTPFTAANNLHTSITNPNKPRREMLPRRRVVPQRIFLRAQPNGRQNLVGRRRQVFAPDEDPPRRRRDACGQHPKRG